MSESSNEQMLVDALRELEPGALPVDQRELFYRAGFEACRIELQAKVDQTNWRKVVGWMPTLAACLATAIVCIPFSYGVLARQYGAPDKNLTVEGHSPSQIEDTQGPLVESDRAPKLPATASSAASSTGPSNEKLIEGAPVEAGLDQPFLPNGVPTNGTVVVLPPDSGGREYGGRSVWLRSWHDRQSADSTLTAFHSRLTLESSPTNLLSNMDRQTQFVSEIVNLPSASAADVSSSSPFTARGVSASVMQQFTHSLEVTH